MQASLTNRSYQEDVHGYRFSWNHIFLAPSAVPVIEKLLTAEFCEIVALFRKLWMPFPSPIRLFSKKSKRGKYWAVKDAYPQGNIVEQLKEVGQDVENTSNQIQTVSQRLAHINGDFQAICDDLKKKNASIAKRRRYSRKDNLNNGIQLKHQDEQVYQIIAQ